jgi:hypothetical protein
MDSPFRHNTLHIRLPPARCVVHRPDFTQRGCQASIPHRSCPLLRLLYTLPRLLEQLYGTFVASCRPSWHTDIHMGLYVLFRRSRLPIWMQEAVGLPGL